MSTVTDVGSRCVNCGEDTAAGSGRYINRVPAESDTAIGYLCAECQAIPCDRCGTDALDWTGNEAGELLCLDCADHEPWFPDF